MAKPRVLFLCTGNACRSQIGEGWLNFLAGDRLRALSAGINPHGVNPLAVEVMGEVGVDLTQHTSDDVKRYLDAGVELVIAVCDSAADACPSFPGSVPVLRWPFPDPAGASGTQVEILEVFRSVRDSIRCRIEEWIADGCQPLAGLSGATSRPSSHAGS